jgi:hypothetical protein
MKVIVGLVPVGRITDSSTSGAARAVAERVSRDRCSRPLEGVFEIGTTVDARQGIGAEVLIVVSPVVDGGIDANLSAFLRSAEMLAGRLAIAVKVRRWSQDANVVDPYLKPALLAADASCLLLGLHLTEEADAGVPPSCRPWRPVLDSILASSLAEDRRLVSSHLSPGGLRPVPDRGSGRVRRRSWRPRRDGCEHVRSRLGRTRSTCSRRRESSVSDPLVAEIALRATLGEPAWTTARVTA